MRVRRLTATAASAIVATGALMVAAVPAQADQVREAADSVCTRITDQSQRTTGLPNVNLYTTYIFDVRNACSTSHNVTIDVQWYPDPPCTTVAPFSTATITYSVDQSAPPGMGDPRGLISC